METALITLQYFSLEILVILKEWTSKLWHRQNLVVSSLLLLAMLIATYYVEGAHQQYVQRIEKQFLEVCNMSLDFILLY